MERLTEKTTDGSGCYKIQAKNLDSHCVAKDKRGYVTYYGQHIDKLAEYEDLEEQDLLLRLPCNPEDKIYAIHKEINGKYYVKEHEVSNINISKLFVLIRCCDGFVFNESDIGKLAFLTKAEAEQKLKEMERD